ncbi:MAG: hypothetical protein KDA37_05170 [Planctomycetales bacterium]|nr:hypothetical protein [Planctomycetales bacterium]
MTAQHRLDVASNRRATKYSRWELLARVAWMILYPAFRYSPRPCFAWRSWLLRRLGARVGRHVHVYPTAIVYYPWMLEVGDYSAIGEDALVYNLGRVTIGQRATISHRAHLCAGTHDCRDPAMPLLRPPIRIGDQAWVCADAFVGPGVKVGEGAVVGARAAVFKDVADWMIVGGNPARDLTVRKMRSDECSP